MTVDFEQILNEAKDKDKLVAIMNKEPWILYEDIGVRDIQCISIESKNQRINSEITCDNIVEIVEA